jgi:hypothetical protein
VHQRDAGEGRGEAQRTERLDEQFRVRLERGLEKREDIGMTFSYIIKDLYPEPSKKRTGGSRLKGRLSYWDTKCHGRFAYYLCS